MRRITPMGGIRMWSEVPVLALDAFVPFLRLSFPRLRRVLLSFASPKESKQRKGDPGLAPGFARSPALLGVGGGCGTRPFGPQTVLALFPPTPALLGASQGARKNIQGQTDYFNFGHFFGPTVAFLFSDRILNPDAFRVPLRGAEQRRRAGDFRRGLFEGRSPEFRSRPACRVAQGTGVAGDDLGVAFFLATFSWRSKKK